MHTVDFISQRFFEDVRDGRAQLPTDHLGHEPLADSICAAIRALPAGQVFAVEGSWGRGKTDLLARVAARTWSADEGKRPQGLAREAVWVNPWRYGDADLLRPLVIELARRAKANKMERGDLKRAAGVLVRAGTAIGLGAAKALLPVPGAVDLVQAPLDKVLEHWLDGTGDGEPVDAVAAMADQFALLVEGALPPEEREHGARLLICIDDLDRCLPDRQVSLLQAIRFLLSAGAPATFLVAIDPVLAREAVRTHYGNADFDVDRYLDKMFDLRVPLRGLSTNDLKELLTAFFDQKLESGDVLGDRCKPVLGLESSIIATSLVQNLARAQLENPRVARRVLDRLLLLLLPGESLSLPLGVKDAAAVVTAWLLIADRWPELRRKVQAGGGNLFHRAATWYAGHAQSMKSNPTGSQPTRDTIELHLATHGLPGASEANGLVALFAERSDWNGAKTVKLVEQLDRHMVLRGL